MSEAKFGREQEPQRSTEEVITGAESLDELIAYFAGIKHDIFGSRRYSGKDIAERIRRVQNYEAGFDYIPMVFGLREKVAKLLHEAEQQAPELKQA